MDIADIRMLSNHRFITFMFSADGYCNSSLVKRDEVTKLTLSLKQ